MKDNVTDRRMKDSKGKKFSKMADSKNSALSGLLKGLHQGVKQEQRHYTLPPAILTCKQEPCTSIRYRK